MNNSPLNMMPETKQGLALNGEPPLIYIHIYANENAGVAKIKLPIIYL